MSNYLSIRTTKEIKEGQREQLLFNFVSILEKMAIKVIDGPAASMTDNCTPYNTYHLNGLMKDGGKSLTLDIDDPDLNEKLEKYLNELLNKARRPAGYDTLVWRLRPKWVIEGDGIGFRMRLAWERGSDYFV
jgi:hypothetical protein